MLNIRIATTYHMRRPFLDPGAAGIPRQTGPWRDHASCFPPVRRRGQAPRTMTTSTRSVRAAEKSIHVMGLNRLLRMVLFPGNSHRGERLAAVETVGGSAPGAPARFLLHHTSSTERIAVVRKLRFAGRRTFSSACPSEALRPRTSTATWSKSRARHHHPIRRNTFDLTQCAGEPASSRFWTSRSWMTDPAGKVAV